MKMLQKNQYVNYNKSGDTAVCYCYRECEYTSTSTVNRANFSYIPTLYQFHLPTKNFPFFCFP